MPSSESTPLLQSTSDDIDVNKVRRVLTAIQESMNEDKNLTFQVKELSINDNEEISIILKKIPPSGNNELLMYTVYLRENSITPPIMLTEVQKGFSIMSSKMKTITIVEKIYRILKEISNFEDEKIYKIIAEKDISMKYFQNKIYHNFLSLMQDIIRNIPEGSGSDGGSRKSRKKSKKVYKKTVQKSIQKIIQKSIQKIIQKSIQKIQKTIQKIKKKIKEIKKEIK